MASVHAIGLMDEITDFLATSPTPIAIVAFHPSDALSQKAHELLEKNRQNQLTTDERSELEAFIQLEHLMSLLKAKARLRLVSAE